MQRSFVQATPVALLAVFAAVFAVLGQPSFAVTPQIPPVASQAPQIPITPEVRGDLAMARQQYMAAIEAYNESSDRTAQLWNKLGIAYHHLFAMDLARRDYERALRLRPDYPEALNNLGAVYYAKRQYRKAEHYYRRALRLSPQSASIYCNLGTAYFAQKKTSQGLAAYREAYTLNPQVFATSSPQLVSEMLPARERAQQDYSIARLFAQAGRYEQALDYLRRALDEGFDDREEILRDQMLASLRSTPEFAELMTEQKTH